MALLSALPHTLPYLFECISLHNIENTLRSVVSYANIYIYADVLYDQLRARLSVQQPWGLPVLIVSSAVKGHRSTKLQHAQQRYNTASHVFHKHAVCVWLYNSNLRNIAKPKFTFRDTGHEARTQKALLHYA